MNTKYIRLFEKLLNSNIEYHYSVPTIWIVRIICDNTDAGDEYSAPLKAPGQGIPPPLGRDLVVSNRLLAGGSTGGECPARHGDGAWS